MRARTAAVAALAVSVGAAVAPAVLPEGDSPRPNIVVVLTDDQTWDSIPRSDAVMPYLQGRALDPRDHWVVFPNAFVDTPLCCPSRATMLTGRFAHHTGVRNNREGPLLDESGTLAAWLDAAGYHTGLVGKYLNGYPFDRGPYVPEGWDRWWGKVQGTPETLYGGFTLIEDGEPVLYGADDHSTDVYAQKAVAFLRDAPRNEPFFLWFAPNAPHPPAIPAPRHAGRLADLDIEAPPSVGEADVTDKPAWVRALPPLDDADAAALLEERRASFEALLGVDEAVRAIVRELEARDELDETLIVYLSDNGLSLGEHRWVGKVCPYEECIRVPFLVRLPGVEHRTDPELVSAADLAPTIVDLAGIAPATTFDGRSLLPLLRHRSRAGRTGEAFSGWIGDGRVPGWSALRRPGWVYIELETGERELYDLRRDPFQLENLAGDPAQAARVAELAAALAEVPGRMSAVRSIAATTLLLLAPVAAPPALAQEQPPDVVVIVADDQRWDTLWAMPVVQRELVARGARFPDAFVVNPICCPSRASVLTGAYSHTTGVYRQAPPFGRFEWFRDGSTLATWLDDAGYTTGLFGKYLDGYQHAGLTGYVPPGWDRWVAFIRSAYEDYKLSIDGRIREHGTAPEDYSTDVLAREAEAFVRQTEGPLFMYLAPAAPHGPAPPAPGDDDAFADLPPWRPEGYDEADVSDKPTWVRALPRLDPAERARIDTLRRNQYASLLALDRAVGRVFAALRETGRLGNTLVLYTSDNGLSWGEHRWSKKEAPYEEVIRVPLVVRWDAGDVLAGSSPGALALNVDLAPTIAEAVGVAAPGAEGRSLLPSLRGESETAPRREFLVEHLAGTNPVPTYCAVRSRDWVYVRYTDGQEELYDLGADPAQLRNLAAEPSASGRLAERRARLDELCDPPPPGFGDPGLDARLAAGAAAMLALVVLGAVAGARRARRSVPS